jgi:hypothetical protein
MFRIFSTCVSRYTRACIASDADRDGDCDGDNDDKNDDAHAGEEEE